MFTKRCQLCKSATSGPVKLLTLSCSHTLGTSLSRPAEASIDEDSVRTDSIYHQFSATLNHRTFNYCSAWYYGPTALRFRQTCNCCVKCFFEMTRFVMSPHTQHHGQLVLDNGPDRGKRCRLRCQLDFPNYIVPRPMGVAFELVTNGPRW
jgi:hypothetical protein